MSWSNGALFNSLIETLLENVPDEDARREIYRDMIGAFETEDWDAHQDVLSIDDVYDELYKEKYPDDFEEGEDN